MKKLILFAILILPSSDLTAQEKNLARIEMTWSSLSKPYGDDTESVVTKMIAQVARQFEISSRIRLTFLGFQNRDLWSGSGGCLAGFLNDADFERFYGRNISGVGAFASLGSISNRNGSCFAVFREPRVDEKGQKQLSLGPDIILHEFGHLAGMKHPNVYAGSLEDGVALPIQNPIFSGQTVMSRMVDSSVNAIFTIHDRVHLAVLGWGVDPDEPSLIPAEPYLRLESMLNAGETAQTRHFPGVTRPAKRDYGMFQLYLPVVEVVDWGGEEIWLTLEYEGFVDGKHQWHLDPALFWTLTDGKWGQKEYLVSGRLSDLVPDYDKYKWRNPARFYSDGTLAIPVLYDEFGKYENVVLKVPDTSLPVDDWKFVLQSIGN